VSSTKLRDDEKIVLKNVMQLLRPLTELMRLWWPFGRRNF